MGERNVLQIFWAENIHTTTMILNKFYFKPNNDKILYEICHGRPTTIKNFKVFGSKCYIQRNDDKLSKFDARDDERIFLGYCQNNKGYKCYNKNKKNIVNCIDVKVVEYIEYEVSKPKNTGSTNPIKNNENDDDSLSNEDKEEPLNPLAKDPTRYVYRNHPVDQIVGDLNIGVQTRRKPLNPCTQTHIYFLLMMEPKNFAQASQDDNWLKAMHE